MADEDPVIRSAIAIAGATVLDIYIPKGWERAVREQKIKSVSFLYKGENKSGC